MKDLLISDRALREYAEGNKPAFIYEAFQNDKRPQNVRMRYRPVNSEDRDNLFDTEAEYLLEAEIGTRPCVVLETFHDFVVGLCVYRFMSIAPYSVLAALYEERF